MISLHCFDTMITEEPLQTIETAIHVIRGQRIMLDCDLASSLHPSADRMGDELLHRTGKGIGW